MYFEGLQLSWFEHMLMLLNLSAQVRHENFFFVTIFLINTQVHSQCNFIDINVFEVVHSKWNGLAMPIPFQPVNTFEKC